MTSTVSSAAPFANSNNYERRKKARTVISDVRPWRVALPRRHIPRPSLWATLDLAIHKKLTVLSAPAGSGKTVLLAQWAQRRCTELGLRWFSVSQHDNDVSRLQLRLSSLPIETRIVVIDDAHVLQCEQAVAALADIIHSKSRDMHWIVSGRGVPDLRQSELAIRDELLHVDEARLRVDVAFIRQFAQACGSERSEICADRVFEETEGWLAGVKLALLPQEERPVAATDSFADAYFADLFQSLPQALRDALLLYSLPDTITPSLADALVEASNDRQVAPFSRIEQAHLFLQRTGRHTDEFRFNRPFHAFLRAASRGHFAQVSHLHHTASRWFFDRRRFDEALQHAEYAGDPEWRLDVLAGALPYFLRSGAIEELLRWSERIDPTDLFARDSVWTAHIAALILARRFYAAAQALELARAPARTASYCAGTKEKLVTLQLMLGLLSGRTKETETGPELYGEHYLTGTLLNLRAYKLLQCRRFDAARRCAHQARKMLLDQGSRYGATHANAVLCAALSRLARYDECRDECERMFDTFSEQARDTSWANAAIALAHIRYEQNRLSEAAGLCAEASPLLSTVASLHGYASCRILLARIRSATGLYEEAWQILDELHGYLDACEARHLLAQLASEKLILCAHRTPETMVPVSEEFALDAVEVGWVNSGSGSAPDDPDLALLGYAQALRLIRLEEFDRALLLIQALLDDAHRHSDIHRSILLEASKAVVCSCLGNAAGMRDALTRALATAGDAGLTRSAFDEIPHFADLFAAEIRSGSLDAARARKYLERFADVFGINPSLRVGGTSAPKKIHIETLTEREADILKLLAQGMSNQEICVHTHIAMTTTKWHLRNIFAKLSVRNRTAALARARTLGLIE